MIGLLNPLLRFPPNDSERYLMVALYRSSRFLGTFNQPVCCAPMFTILGKVVGVISHSIAILSTVFRLVYRGWTRNFWWEDGWAAFALISDGRVPLRALFLTFSKPANSLVFCLACIWVDRSISCKYSFTFQD